MKKFDYVIFFDEVFGDVMSALEELSREAECVKVKEEKEESERTFED